MNPKELSSHNISSRPKSTCYHKWSDMVLTMCILQWWLLSDKQHSEWVTAFPYTIAPQLSFENTQLFLRFFSFEQNAQPYIMCNDTSLQPVFRSYPIRPFHKWTGVAVTHFGAIGSEVVAVVFQNTVVVVWLSRHHTLFRTWVTLWSIYLVSHSKVIKFTTPFQPLSNLLTRDYSIYIYSLYPCWFVQHSNKHSVWHFTRTDFKKVPVLTHFFAIGVILDTKSK